MTDSLVHTRNKLEKTLNSGGGSLDAFVDSGRVSVLLVDVSGSMDEVMATGTRRIDELRKVVGELMTTHPVPVAAFGVGGGSVAWVDTTIPEPSGGTPLAAGIDFVKTAGATHAVVISDGVPDDKAGALSAARRFGGPIDVFFVGDPGDPGEAFMRELARVTGGRSDTVDLSETRLLKNKIAGLLGDGS